MNWREQRVATRKAQPQRQTFTVRHRTAVSDHALGIITAMKEIHWLEKEELPAISILSDKKKSIFACSSRNIALRHKYFRGTKAL